MFITAVGEQQGVLDRGGLPQMEPAGEIQPGADRGAADRGQPGRGPAAAAFVSGPATAMPPVNG
ncbi:hypothetical protein ACWGLG_21095 [Streptomyces antimycoticus]